MKGEVQDIKEEPVGESDTQEESESLSPGQIKTEPQSTADEAMDAKDDKLEPVKDELKVKTEQELEDELIGEEAAGEDELPSGDGDVDDELRLDDEDDELEDRSWRR